MEIEEGYTRTEFILLDSLPRVKFHSIQSAMFLSVNEACPSHSVLVACQSCRAGDIPAHKVDNAKLSISLVHLD